MSILLRPINKNRSLSNAFSGHIVYYPTPVAINYAWSFGSLVGIFFALQILTGVFLAMHYTPHVEFAFQSVAHIMTNVNHGYFIRYMHANGASMIFILMYLHIARSLYLRSYTGKRKILWWSGIVIFLLMMATAFIGYVLPWGQMSFWGATVITSLVTAVPFVGENIAYWLWGGFSVSNATLIRFFSLHYLLPFIITGIILTHLVLLHNVGSCNPLQHQSVDKKPFHPYFTAKDSFILSLALLFFIILVSFYPNLLGHSDNFIPANPLVTPAHIVPEWYFTPFYAILRACPNKLGGVISMLAAILILFLLPFFKVTTNSIPTNISWLYKLLFWLFIANFMILMFLGGQPAAAPFVVCSKFFTCTYFAYFLLCTPILNWINALTLATLNPQVVKKTENYTVSVSKNKAARRKFWKPAPAPSKILPFSTFYVQKKHYRHVNAVSSISSVATASTTISTGNNTEQQPLYYTVAELREIAKSYRYKDNSFFGEAPTSRILKFLNNFSDYFNVAPFILFGWGLIKLTCAKTGMISVLIGNVSIFWVWSAVYFICVLVFIKQVQLLYFYHFLRLFVEHFYNVCSRLYKIHYYGPLFLVFYFVILLPDAFRVRHNTALWEYALEFVSTSIFLYCSLYVFFFYQICMPLIGLYDRAVKNKRMTTSLRWILDEPFVRMGAGLGKAIFERVVDKTASGMNKQWNKLPPETQEKYINRALIASGGALALDQAHEHYMQQMESNARIENESKAADAKVRESDSVVRQNDATTNNITAQTQEAVAETNRRNAESAARVRKTSAETGEIYGKQIPHHPMFGPTGLPKSK